MIIKLNMHIIHEYLLVISLYLIPSITPTVEMICFVIVEQVSSYKVKDKALQVVTI